MKIQELPFTVSAVILATVMQEAIEAECDCPEKHLIDCIKLLCPATTHRFVSCSANYSGDEKFTNWASSSFFILNELGLWGYRGPLLRLYYVLSCFGPGADNDVSTLTPHLKRSKAKKYLEQYLSITPNQFKSYFYDELRALTMAN